MSDELMKLMGWLSVDPIDHSLATGLTEPYTRETLNERAQADKPFTRLVQQFLDEQERKQLWTPPPVNATGRVVTPSPAAASAPGSMRHNNVTFFMEKWDRIDASGCSWSNISSTYYNLAFRDMQIWRDPGRKISAAPEGDDEPIEPGFVSTGARDDFAANAAHYGLKPGDPDFHEKARDWIDEEKYDRYRSGAFDHAARVAVRDAHLERYAQSEADALIEEMMDP